jgi:hypothetical protein
MVPDESEPRLLARAREFDACPELENLTPEKLRQIADVEGLDFATGLLFERATRIERTARFIEEIDRAQSAQISSHLYAAETPIIAIVPAAFYAQKPDSGADGRVVKQAVIRMNLECELVPVRSTGTLAENSAILLDWLERHSDRPIIVVSLCKGGADVKFALRKSKSKAHFTNVLAWVNICGTLNGSPIAQWLLATKLRSFATWLFLISGGHNLEFLQEVVPSPNGALSGPIELPSKIQLINIVGFPLRRHLENGFMRRCHQALSSQGPNDGGVLLLDVCRLPGLLYPVWGADHYLRPGERAQRIIAGVLNWLMNSCDLAHSREALQQAS